MRTVTPVTLQVKFALHALVLTILAVVSSVLYRQQAAYFQDKMLCTKNAKNKRAQHFCALHIL
uniref:Hypothetical secreted peptide 572 n=1 Tax=Amblyomma variegatum TaxID=34610 RepID=F0JA63_AMBVA|nr:TPA_inf: hypothetical secreted peptide precursor 572 [Amblyomma variegatum]